MEKERVETGMVGKEIREARKVRRPYRSHIQTFTVLGVKWGAIRVLSKGVT